ncbi:uncharacterized protein [Palaemon carinicauda]|uniref:uncharacterized protein n=1 Tax=Palaemon carinicauda TaxID=392227 RepID=UPI0035B68FE3
MLRLRKVFEALKSAVLVVNLAKCELGQAKVCYLGHEVGLGQVAPKQANLEANINFKRPGNDRGMLVMLALGVFSLSAEKRYSTIEKEAVSLVRALNYIKPYVTNFYFPLDMWTAHNPLVFLEWVKRVNQRILRWAIFLQEFNLIVKPV